MHLLNLETLKRPIWMAISWSSISPGILDSAVSWRILKSFLKFDLPISFECFNRIINFLVAVVEGVV